MFNDHKNPREDSVTAADHADTEWDCEAYGPGGRAFGATCFFSTGIRTCASAAACAERMTAERQRVWQRIQDLAQAGDETAIYLAESFPTPDTILNGGE